MKKIRINELARELEVKAHEILDRLPELGVAEKKPPVSRDRRGVVQHTVSVCDLLRWAEGLGPVSVHRDNPDLSAISSEVVYEFPVRREIALTANPRAER